MRFSLFASASVLLACGAPEVEQTQPLYTVGHAPYASSRASLALSPSGKLLASFGGTLYRFDSATHPNASSMYADRTDAEVQSVATDEVDNFAYVTQLDRERREGDVAGEVTIHFEEEISHVSYAVPTVSVGVVLANDSVWVAGHSATTAQGDFVTRYPYGDAEYGTQYPVPSSTLIGAMAVETDRLWLLATDGVDPYFSVFDLEASDEPSSVFELPGPALGLWSTPAGVRFGVGDAGGCDLYDRSQTKVGTLGTLGDVTILSMTDRYAYVQLRGSGTNDSVCVGSDLVRIDVSDGSRTVLDTTVCEVRASVAHDDCLTFIELFDATYDADRWPFKLKRICTP